MSTTDRTGVQTLVSWVTGDRLPIGTTYDDTTVPGARLPLGEDDLRMRTRAQILVVLDEHGLSMQAWLRHLLVAGHAAFGLTPTPLAVLGAQRSDVLTRHGVQVLTAQVLAAKRRLDSPREDDERPTGQLAFVPVELAIEAIEDRDRTYDMLCNLADDQFEAVLIRLGVPLEHLPSSAAPQATRAVALLQLARTGRVSLGAIRVAAQAELGAPGTEW
jgi:hypothetical protein